MTPEELAAIRADYWDVDMRLRALCDALEAAWAGRSVALKIARANLADYREMRARADRAEASLVDLQAWADHEGDRADRAEEASASERQKVVNLTGELAVVNDHLADVIERAERAEAEVARLNVVIFDNNHVWAKDITARNAAQCALARVRALCDLDPVEWALAGSDMARIIRAAIEGDTQ